MGDEDHHFSQAVRSCQAVTVLAHAISGAPRILLVKIKQQSFLKVWGFNTLQLKREHLMKRMEKHIIFDIIWTLTWVYIPQYGTLSFTSEVVIYLNVSELAISTIIYLSTHVRKRVVSQEALLSSSLTGSAIRASFQSSPQEEKGDSWEHFSISKRRVKNILDCLLTQLVANDY